MPRVENIVWLTWHVRGPSGTYVGSRDRRDSCAVSWVQLWTSWSTVAWSTEHGVVAPAGMMPTCFF